MKRNPDIEKSSSGGIDELLNSFIDGELTAEQQTEVEQLIANDAKIVKRLRQLQQCKMLVGSLPHAEAPAEVLEGIKASLTGTTPPAVEQTWDGGAAKKYLLVRRVLSAAAMIGLVAVLATVIYMTLTPRTSQERPTTSIGFSGKLELKTSDLLAVSAFVNRAIEDRGLSDSVSPERRQDRRIYSLSCSMKDLNLLMVDLEHIWPELASATLSVYTEVFGEQVVVNSVTTQQIAHIAEQNNIERRIELAKDFAALNNMAARLPGREILAAIEGGNRSLITIPKPFLTGKQGTMRKPVGRADDKETVHLTIIVNW